MNYRITRKANRDIERICDRIARDDPAAADRVDEKIHKAIHLLADFPGLGHTRSDVTNPNYRFRAVGNYMIAYRVEVDQLVVVRVVHGARDFRDIFGGN